MGIAFRGSDRIRYLLFFVLISKCGISPAQTNEPLSTTVPEVHVALDDSDGEEFDASLTQSGVVDAVYSSFEKAGIIQVADKKAAPNVVKTGTEASPPVEAHIQSKGTSADKVKKQALTELPLDKLLPKDKARVSTLLGEVGYFRRLPTTVLATEPDVYTFFIRYPDAAVSIWRVMGISEMEMWQTGPNEYEGDSHDGSTGIIDVLYRGPDSTLILCEGQYQSPILKKPIRARSLVLLKWSFTRETDGTTYVTHRADMYVTFPSQTVETAARILSPVTGAMADRTFSEMSLFLRMMSLAMTRRPAWVEQIAGQMEGVPEARKNQLRQLSLQVYNSERKRIGLTPSGKRTIGPIPPARVPEEVGATALPDHETASAIGPISTPKSIKDSTVAIKPKLIPKEEEPGIEADFAPEVVPLPESLVSRQTVTELQAAPPPPVVAESADKALPNEGPQPELKPEKSNSQPATTSSEKPRSKPKLEPGYQYIPKRQRPI